MGTKRYSHHPACLAFPMMPEAELKDLAEDITLRGLLTPIVRHQGKILDGRNRLAACQIADVKPRFVEWEGGGSPTEWVIATNLFRRQLTASQRAVIALELLPLLEEEAKERQRRSQGRGKKAGKQLPTNPANGKASQMAAKLTKSNRLYVQTAKGIRQAAPELIEEIRAGKLTVPDAKRLAELPLKQRQTVLKRASGQANGSLKKIIKAVQIEDRRKEARRFQKIKGGSDDQNILIGDMGILWDRLPDGSVDLFLTDPPYTDIAAYARLVELAAAKLKQGGFCLAYTGHVQLPDVIAAMLRHLSWWWLFCVEVADQPKPIHSRRIQCRQKPIVAFAKTPLKQPSDWLGDLIQGGGRDKTFHEWGQAASEAAYLIQRLTDPGALIVEPYCGGGFVPAAAKATGRAWLATERDEATALIARRRLAEMDG